MCSSNFQPIHEYSFLFNYWVKDVMSVISKELSYSVLTPLENNLCSTQSQRKNVRTNSETYLNIQYPICSVQICSYSFRDIYIYIFQYSFHTQNQNFQPSGNFQCQYSLCSNLFCINLLKHLHCLWDICNYNFWTDFTLVAVYDDKSEIT